MKVYVVILIMGMLVIGMAHAIDVDCAQRPLDYVLGSSGTMTVDGETTRLVIRDGVLAIYNSEYARKELTEVIIPTSVICIGDEAFYANKLSTVIIPNKITRIGRGAFAMNPLTELTFGKSVKTIDRWAFFGNQLITVTLSREFYEVLHNSRRLYSILGHHIETYKDFDGTVLN